VCSSCGRKRCSIYDRRVARARDLSAAGFRIELEFERLRVSCPRCGVHVERLDWLAKNPRYTARYALHVGALCRKMTVKDVAAAERLHHSTVKDLDKLYMAEQLRRHPLPATAAIGVDEIAIRKGHDYRVVVSCLETQRPIWFGGTGRKQEDLAQFFTAYGGRRCKGIRVVVMDMWRPFRQATREYAPQAEIVFYKFHILRHLNDALDEVRRSEYARVQGRQRRFIKGNRYTLLAHRENLDLDGRAALNTLLAANKRLNTAYLLKESFGQLWDYKNATWARKFFDHWKASLKWQRLKPFEKFAQMIERHWDNIVSYCKPDNKVSLGCVEGLNNTIRVIQRNAYGFRDEQYLAMKIITHFLPPLPKHAKITHTIPR
jgi:transposase